MTPEHDTFTLIRDFAAAPAETSTFQLYPRAGHADLHRHGFFEDLIGVYSATSGKGGL